MSKLTQVNWKEVSLGEGFWGQWQHTNARATVNAIYDRFHETGRIDAMRLSWQEGMDNKPHIFWDSDVAKWMEGAAYILYYHPDEEISKKLETVIDYIEQGQDEDGYFNSYFLTCEPVNRFNDRTAHELYTAGHMMEAAVAHFYSTGSKRFLNIMTRFADFIEKAFKLEGTANYSAPGHQEIELALVRLWQATGEDRYLELSKHFIDIRGTQAHDRIFSVRNGTWPASPPLNSQLLYNDTYAQDDAPARELPAAAGHAVRAMYFYSSMADISREYGDKELYEACLRLWDDATLRKMYVTGGVSAERFGEAIGAAYMLPNQSSYAETCASIAMAFFAQRMFSIEPDARYADIIERQMYNGALAGLSLDGTGFFYDNALQSVPAHNDFLKGVHDTRNLFPNYRRERVFECSCCPPNILRFIAAIGEYVYATQEDTLYISQYVQSKANIKLASGSMQVEQTTNYPWTETVQVQVGGESVEGAALAFRMPGWCTNPTVSIDGTVVYSSNAIADGLVLKNGYLHIPVSLMTDGAVSLSFPMPVVEMEANPLVMESAGKVALMRGPVVYCLEAVDNPFNIFDMTILSQPEYSHSTHDINGVPMVMLHGNAAVRIRDDWNQTLYRPSGSRYTHVSFTAVPYFAWANREPGEMAVWLQKESNLSG
ncbi:glycoside hydrolase family 127 protein [Paenibacillus lignilyticus]|uniref:Glycoside hydrolase family 127 protein n=1 Tax=Paenibacillus lignilyticus TaxID=1172615 RepID=A0ABS5C8L1_9BACL|nr:beta-L-arabinofuranosidase domain-containing protein [Paenibacillus lignilyticus]MBP3962339.1 glycoside hydrolase family 127 protein [Paenibacillus lignilyticus]